MYQIAIYTPDYVEFIGVLPDMRKSTLEEAQHVAAIFNRSHGGKYVYAPFAAQDA